MTPTSSPKLKLVSEQDAAALVMDSYVLRRRTQLCQNCECGELGSTIFEVWVHPTKTPLTGFRSERLFNGLELDHKYPLRVVNMPDRLVPYCAECGDTYSSSATDTKGREVFPPCSAEQWAETLRRKYAPEPASAVKKPEPSLDML